MKYDDPTLIKFVDNELDDSLMSEIRDEMLLDKELGARLNVVSLISNDNIIRAQKYGQTLLQNSQSNIEVSKIHENIKIKNAEEIVPKNYLGKFTSNSQKKMLSAFSDYFRYKLLTKNGGWWFDTDCYCLKNVEEFSKLSENRNIV